MATPSAWFLAKTISAVIPPLFSVFRSASSVVVPPRTPTFLPAKACRSRGPSARIMRLAPSTYVAIEKSTSARRESVALVEPVGGGDRNIENGQPGQLQLVRQFLGNRPAEIHHEA